MFFISNDSIFLTCNSTLLLTCCSASFHFCETTSYLTLRKGRYVIHVAGPTHVQDTSNCPVNHSQQTRDTGLMIQRWASVADGGITLKQHRLSVWWLLGCSYIYCILYLSNPSKHETFTQCRFNAGPAWPASLKISWKVLSLVGHRLYINLLPIAADHVYPTTRERRPAVSLL